LAVLFILVGLVPLVHFAVSSGVIIFYSEPITAVLCFPPLVIGILLRLAYSMSKSPG